jgi:hypothetical protein
MIDQSVKLNLTFISLLQHLLSASCFEFLLQAVS